MSVKKLFFIVGFVIVVSSVVGQPQNPPTPPPPNPVPLTGAEYLIAAGAALGAKKFLDARKRRKAESEGTGN